MKPAKITLVLTLLVSSALSAVAASAQQQAPSPGLPPEWNGKIYGTSMELYKAMEADANIGRKKTAILPDWKGLWSRKFDGAIFAFGAYQPANPKLSPSGPPLYGLAMGAKLTPDAQAKWDKKVADVAKGVEWDQLSNCLPAGFPRWLTEPFLREFIVTPEETWQITEQQSEARRVYTDGRGHVPDDEAYPLWDGDSIGFWDVDTLVVHTKDVKPGQYQRGQPDYSDKTSTVERIRRSDPNTITDEVWVYDPETLMEAWHVAFHYEKVTTPGLRINMWSCEENNNVKQTANGASDFSLPGEAGYKDPDKLGQSSK